MRGLAWLGCALLVGCSAIVSPDESRLARGKDPDAGPLPDGDRPDRGGRRDAGSDCPECPLGCSSSGDCFSMIPSNVPKDLVDPMARDLRLEGSMEFVMDTSACAAVMATTRVVPQEGGPELCVLIVHDLTIATGTTLRVRGNRGLVILASGVVRSAGTIDLSGAGPTAGPGGGAGAVGVEMENGGGAGGGLGGAHVDEFDDGGGGGGSLCGAGGEGGAGAMAAGGAGGETVAPTWELSPLMGGSGGGRGRGRFSGGTTNAGFGGGGGGALQITSMVRIETTGRILAGGGAGLGGRNAVRENWGSGGGGGSGGAILIEAPELVVGGSILATGGGGGGGAGATASGANGENGATIEGRANGGAGGDSAFGGDGGSSGGGGDTDAEPGESLTMAGANGGGGGGGAGCILFRNATGEMPDRVRLSPSDPPAARALRVRVE